VIPDDLAVFLLFLVVVPDASVVTFLLALVPDDLAVSVVTFHLAVVPDDFEVLLPFICPWFQMTSQSSTISLDTCWCAFLPLAAVLVPGMVYSAYM
jgi:hypothetical protein